MVEKIATEAEFHEFIKERQVAAKLRDAITFCKGALDITAVTDRKLDQDQRVGFEKCLTENYLLKYGNNYFGKRDLIYIDLYGTADIKAMQTSVWKHWGGRGALEQ